MRTKGSWMLAAAAAVALAGPPAVAEQVFEFKDGTLIKGEIQNPTLTVKTGFGQLQPPTDGIVFISEGTVEMREGSRIMGELVLDDGLVVKTKYGTWTLRFKPEDVKMITFQK